MVEHWDVIAEWGQIATLARSCADPERAGTSIGGDPSHFVSIHPCRGPYADI